MTLPQALAEITLAALGKQLPIITTPGTPAYSTLLTRPHTTDLGTLPDTCARLGIGLAYGGQHGKPSDYVINLPPSRHRRGTTPQRWLQPPITPLPPFDAVTTALLAALVATNGRGWGVLKTPKPSQHGDGTF